MSRQKTVFDSRQVAHIWANGSAPEGRNGGQNNFYFHGDTIYSYGSHFPIARFATEVKGTTRETCPILFTTRSYSSTTAKHICFVRYALSDSQRDRVIRCYNPSASSQDSHVKNWNNIRDNYLETLKSATKARGRKADILRTAEGLRQSANHYRKVFKLSKVKGVKELKQTEDWQSVLADAQRMEDKAAAQRAAADERRRIAAEAADAANRDWWQKTGLSLWKAGETYYVDENNNCHRLSPPWSAPVDFRLINDGTEVETTKYAQFPRSHCERAFRAILACRAAGQTFHSNGRTIRIGHFHIDEIDAAGNVVAGCHHVRWQEIEAFAKELGLDFTPPATIDDATEVTSEVS
jgi:hypothetical protein